MILHFDEEHVPGFVEANLVGLVERRLQGWPAIARVAFCSGPGDGGQLMALQVQAAHPVIANLAEVERAIRSDDETIGIVGLPRGAGSAIPGKAGDPGSGKVGHGLWRASQKERQKNEDESAHRLRVHYIFREEESF